MQNQRGTPPGWPAVAGHDSCGESSLQLDLVFLDHGVGEQLLAHRLQLIARLRLVGSGEFDVDHLALPHFADAAEAQPVQRMPDGLALRVQHTVLQRHEYARFHLTSCGPFTSPCTCSGMMPSRLATSEYASTTPPRSRRKRSLSIFSLEFTSHRRHESGLISSASTIRM